MPQRDKRLAVAQEDRGRGQFVVLVVDDEEGTRDEYCEFLTALGYPCLQVADGIEALKVISANPDVGIVLTDLDMPAMDGISLLSELQARFAPFRPLIPIVVTGIATLETAVEAMRADAIDFLPKPISPSLLAATLRRATARWTILQSQFRLLTLMELGNASSRKPESAAGKISSGREPDRIALQKFLRTIIKARQRRSEFMDASKFADPAWDIMLDLTSAALEGRSVPALSASAAANVPLSTALRYVKRLVEDGVIKRWDDPDDKRRSLLAIEDQVLEGMIKYLSNVYRSVATDLFEP